MSVQTAATKQANPCGGLDRPWSCPLPTNPPTKAKTGHTTSQSDQEIHVSRRYCCCCCTCCYRCTHEPVLLVIAVFPLEIPVRPAPHTLHTRADKRGTETCRCNAGCQAQNEEAGKRGLRKVFYQRQEKRRHKRSLAAQQRTTQAKDDNTGRQKWKTTITWTNNDLSTCDDTRTTWAVGLLSAAKFHQCTEKDKSPKMASLPHAAVPTFPCR